MSEQHFIPEEGKMLIGQSGPTRLWVVPSAAHAGFFFVTRIDFDPMHPVNGDAIAEGLKRPVRRDFVEDVLAVLTPRYEDFTWATLATAPHPTNGWLDGEGTVRL